MNGKQIMDKVITYNTSELTSIKAQMATVLDKMAAAIPTLKASGMSDLDIRTQADMTIRQQLRRTLNGKEDYMVERDGRTAIIGIGATVANAIVDMFESKI